MPSRYFRNTGSTDWQLGTNWSATDGGGSVGAIPTGADDVFFTALSGNCVVNVNSNALTLTTTGYTGTLTLDGNYILIATGGSVVLGSGMHLETNATSTNGAIRVVSASITTNGITIPILATTGTGTITLLDTLRVRLITAVVSNVPTYAGSFGFIATYYSAIQSAGNILTLAAGVTYTVDKFVWNTEKGSAHGLIRSSDTATHVKAILTITGDINIGYIDFTDINASSGRTIYTFNGVVTSCTNVTTLTDNVTPVNSTVATSILI